MMNHYREWIIRYHGNLQKALQGTHTMIDIINERYAIIKIHDGQISYLRSLMQIEHMEESRRIYKVAPWIDSSQMISQEKKRRGVSGKGVIVGWIDHQININYEHYNKSNGTTRILYIHNGIRQYNQKQVMYIGKNKIEDQTVDKKSPMDMCIGDEGIASDSKVILVNWQNNIFHTADAIRSLRFIINKALGSQAPLVIYFPFDISKGTQNNLIREIVSDMILWGKIVVVSSLEIGCEDLERNVGLNSLPIFSTYAPLTVGALSLVMEWGIVRGNEPSLYGQKLRTYYIKNMVPLLRKDSFYRRSCNIDGLDELLRLLLPMPVIEEFRTLDIAYEFAPEDAIIDVFVIYDSFDVAIPIVSHENTSLYPLVFPYLGVRGYLSEIKELIGGSLGTMVTGNLAHILGNQPLNITPTPFKPVSIVNRPLQFKGRGTLIGIIDTGIDYTNPAFIDSNGETRIVSIWDQTIGTDSPYGYGTVYDRKMINKALESQDPFEIVPHKDEWGQGTILAGIAAGSGKYEEGIYKGVAPEAEIVVVKLKPANHAMQEIYYSKYSPLGFSALDIARAVQYLATLSNQYQKPISICLPSGTNSGSHDGTNVLDAIVMIYADNPGVCVVLPAGEEANKGHHASGDLKEKEEHEIKLTIPKGQGGFMIEIWAMFGDKLEVSLTVPKVEGEDISIVLLNKGQTYKLPGTSFVWSQGSKIDRDTGCQVIRFRLGNPIQGDWIIKVKGIVIIEGRYNIWIPKTGMILPGTVLWPANPFTTISSTSAAVGLITVACYDKKSQSPTPSSGRGFSRDNRVKPDFMVSGVDIPGPLPDNKWGLITGTSPASAIAAGITSFVYEDQIIQGVESVNTIGMKAILVENVKRDSTIEYPNPSRGYGLLGSTII